MDNSSPKQQIIDRLKQATNILVTVSENPSVDQLSACLGLTLMLNKMGKHGTAVFSGNVPSTIEFLKPEDTLEKNTDSLRDFIIALDKSKADKLRYKVEDKVVKIFITPYKTSLSEKDLEFSQGDFNIDAIVALGVQQQSHLDKSVTSNGRILHDAVVVSINASSSGNSDIGSVNWQDTTASSLSEIVTQLGIDIDKSIFDPQISTALLTGIVAATDRFSNEKTTARTMSLSAQLVGFGANPQLVASELEGEAPETPVPPVKTTPPPEPPVPSEKAAPKASVAKSQDDVDGTLNIKHEDSDNGQIEIDNQGVLRRIDEQPPAGPSSNVSAGTLNSETSPDNSQMSAPDVPGSVPAPSYVSPPPTSPINANIAPESLEPTTDPLSLSRNEDQLLSRDSEEETPADSGQANYTAPPVTSKESETMQPGSASTPVSVTAGEETDPNNLSSQLDDARSAVDQAVSSGVATLPPKPIEALNANPVFDSLNNQPVADVLSPAPVTGAMSHHTNIQPPSGPSSPLKLPDNALNTLNMPLPSDPFSVPDQTTANNPPDVSGGYAPPPVPPPIMPPYGPLAA